jgi:hypothetical protein
MKLTNPIPRTPRAGAVLSVLPGPDRKRTPAEYRFRVMYRNPRPTEPGCVMVWEVLGGRLPYQIASERTERGDIQWHCTCADAVYRGDGTDHECKHVRGLLDVLEEVSLPAGRSAA